MNQAEGLQDFRRRNEGTLIIADDRPLLVMEWGKKYTGPNPGKYMIEGKYAIPVGYKVIVKWDEELLRGGRQFRQEKEHELKLIWGSG